MLSSKEQIQNALEAIPVIDTHEHFMSETEWAGTDDFFTLLSPYVVDVLTCAGMSADEWNAVQDKKQPFARRWEIFVSYLPLIRHTRYFRTADRVYRERYGLMEYTLDEAQRVSPLIAADGTTDGYFRLCAEANIRAVMTFTSFDCHRTMKNSAMVPVPTVSDIHFKDLRMLGQLSVVTGVRILSFDALLCALDRLFADYREAGIKAVKFGGTYRRVPDYRLTAHADAERVFTEVLRCPQYGDTILCGACPNGFTDEFLRPLDDFLTFYMVGLAGNYGMNVFFHCGIHAWNANDPDILIPYIVDIRPVAAVNPYSAVTVVNDIAVPEQDPGIFVCDGLRAELHRTAPVAP